MLADRIDQLGPGQTARVDGLLNVLDFLHGELASGQNLWRSVSDQHAAAPKRPPYHLKTVFACPLLFCDKKFLQVGLSCSNFTGSRTMRQSCLCQPRSLSGIDFVVREINKLRTEVRLQVIDSSSKICSLRHPPSSTENKAI